MKRLTTLALLAGMFSIPVLHGEEAPADRSCAAQFPVTGRDTGGIPADESASTTGADPSATPEVPVIQNPLPRPGRRPHRHPRQQNPRRPDPATRFPSCLHRPIRQCRMSRR